MIRGRNRGFLSIGAIALIVLIVATLSFVSGVRYSHLVARVQPQDLKRPVLDDELKPFLTKFGKPRFSSHEEELFVRDFFADKRDGVFVDVGASHYRDRSNTYYLETELGWSGVAIDPIADFAADYRAHRPRTQFFALFVSDRSDEQASLHVGRNSLFSSADREFTHAFTDVERTITARTMTLDDLLASISLAHVDFVSMDIELHEPQALSGFNIEKFKPELLCIEAHPQVRQQILNYFATRGYVLVAKYLRADPQNLWFTPAK
jgi:FkbM family methyltransferase